MPCNAASPGTATLGSTSGSVRRAVRKKGKMIRDCEFPVFVSGRIFENEAWRKGAIPLTCRPFPMQ